MEVADVRPMVAPAVSSLSLVANAIASLSVNLYKKYETLENYLDKLDM